MQENEELTRQLLESLSNDVVKPKLPQKVEVYHQRRPIDIDDNEQPDPPVVKLGKNITKYGMLVGKILLNDLKNDTDAISKVDKDST